jgi:hypothetical protein
MNATITNLPVWRTWQKSRQTTVVAVCEDTDTCARANEFCRDFHNYLGQDCKDAKAVWLFSQLRLPKLREIAADEAALTDLILISVHAADSLPDEVKIWIDLWVGQKGNRPAVLVALLDAANQGSTTVMRSYLQETARRGGMSFVVQLTE